MSLGLAFQAVDDLLDVTGTGEELGKDASHDAESGKVTFVALLGEDMARRERKCIRATHSKSWRRDWRGEWFPFRTSEKDAR